VDAIAGGCAGVLVGTISGQIRSTPLAEVVSRKKPLDARLLELAGVLAK
jgi:6-phosphofructokinase 1